MAGVLTLALALAVAASFQPAGASVVAADLRPQSPGGDELTTVSNDVQVYPVALRTGVAASVASDAWTTVNLDHTYSSMVVVAVPNYSAANLPLVTRIQNATTNSFDVRVDRFDGISTGISGIPVHYMVVEAGVYNTADHGVSMEAVTFTSTVTDRTNSWNGESQAYSNSYISPVVLGQS